MAAQAQQYRVTLTWCHAPMARPRLQNWYEPDDAYRAETGNVLNNCSAGFLALL
jgi:hypothetical protein